MDEKKEKRALNNELDENVKKASVTALGDDENVVMSQELSDDDLDQAAGGRRINFQDVKLVDDSLQIQEKPQSDGPETDYTPIVLG